MSQTSVSKTPIVNGQEYLPYLILNQNLKIQKFSKLLRQYAEEDRELAVGNDVRLAFPELIGLEEICTEILNNKQDQFILESVAREVEEDKVLYFDICIQNIKDRLILLFEDVTELVKLRQSFIQKANEAELTLNALKRFEYCTNKILDSMGDILLITTPSGKIERSNKAAENLLGISKLKLINADINNIFSQKDFSYSEIYQYLVDNKKTIKKIESCFVTQEKQTREIEFNCFVVPTEIPNVYNCVYIGRDITLRKKAERDMLQALEKEKELRKLKSGFISMASHEFRNPLSSILVCTDMLSQDNTNLPPEDKEFYRQIIKESALNIQTMLEDILVLSKAESDKQTLTIILIELKEFCQQIIREVQLTYPDRTINLLLSQDEIEFLGDSKLLWHILTNLLSNALKYSSAEEAVEIKITSQELKITIEICDRGIGIPLEAQKHLFESFYRASNVGIISGTGLGLAIVKRAVDLHQGTIEVSSELEKGTTIKIQLPNKSSEN